MGEERKPTTRLEEFEKMCDVLTMMAERAGVLEEERIAACLHVVSGAIGRFTAGGDDSHLVELANFCDEFVDRKYKESQEETKKKIKFFVSPSA